MPVPLTAFPPPERERPQMRIRQLPKLLAAAMVAAIGLAGPALAQDPPDPEPPVTIPSDAVDPDADAGDGVTHSWALAPAASAGDAGSGHRPNLSYSLEPGAVLEDAVTLFNYSNVQLTFRVYAVDAVNNDAGKFDLLPADEPSRHVGTWIDVEQAEVTVPPGRQVTMPVTIRVPADADPGDSAGAIVASNESEGVGPDGKVVMLERRTGSRVYIRVAGELTPDLAIDQVETTYGPSANPLGGTADVSYRITNRGNTRMLGSHRVSVAGPFGIGKRSAPERELDELLPGESVTFRTSLSGVPAAGLAFTEVRLDPASPDGDDLDPATRRGRAFAPPITLVLAGAALALAVRAARADRRHGTGGRSRGMQQGRALGPQHP